MLEYTPTFSSDAAERIARRHFGRSGPASPLPSERDQNFLIDDEHLGPIVLKIANAAENRDVLEAQQKVLGALAARGAPVPRVVCTSRGEPLVEVENESQLHLAWAVTRLDGVPLADVAHRSTAVLEQVGRCVAALTRALEGVEHPALARDFLWDLRRGAALVAERRSMIAD